MKKASLFVQLLCGLTTLAFLAGCGGGPASTTTSSPFISVGVGPTTASLGGGGTQAFTATIANDSANAGVTWSIGSGAGTLSASTKTGVTYTAPSVVSAASTVTLTASSITDTTKSGAAGITLTVASTSAIAITSLSTTSPIAMTPITVTTSGVNTSSAISFTFSDSSGFSVTESPIRVDTSGSGKMIVAVPLYVNPTTGATGADTVSLVVAQGTQVSAAVSVDIQDLPSVASYGATPGQISHAALIFEALVIGQRINDLQAFQALPGNTVGTSAAQSALKTLLTPILHARSDVDSVTSNSSLVIPGGVSTTSGSPVQFDATALDTMDRVNGVFLSEVLTLPGSNSQLRSKASQARPRGGAVSTFVEGMGLVTNLASYEESMLTTLSSSQSFSSYTVSDYAKALSATVGTTLSTAGTLSGNKLLGISGAVFSALPTVGTAMGNDAVWVQGWVTGDSALTNAAQGEMQKGQTDAWTATADLTAAVVGSTSLSKIFGAEAVTTGASTILDMAALFTQTQESGEYAAINLQSVPISSTTPPSSPSQGIAIAEGAITVSGATAQSGLDFCCFNDLGITGIVDAGGNYESFIPLRAANANYGDITLDATNPLTDATLGSETVDLSGLDTTTPITVTTLTTSTTPPAPTTPPAAGTYAGSCNVSVGSITCCADGICSTVPGDSTSDSFDYTVASGATLSGFDSAVCGQVDSALAGAGCASESCSYAAATSTSFTFNLSCTLPAETGCTTAAVTETCTASN